MIIIRETRAASPGKRTSRKPPKPRKTSRWILLGLFLLGGVGGLVALGEGEGEAVPAAPSIATPPKSDWITIVQPFELYDLPSPQFGQEPSLYEARRRTDRDEREDVLTFGGFGEAGGYLRIAIDRAVGATREPSAFFGAMARQAAQAGLAITQSRQPNAMTTGFGSFDVADLVVADPAQHASCLGFRRQAGGPDIGIEGLACGPVSQPMDRTTLACLIDRLDLMAAADDPELADFFAAAQLNRDQTCPTGALNPTQARLIERDPVAATQLHENRTCVEPDRRQRQARRAATC